MYEIIQKAHSGIAYLSLLLLVVAVANAFVGKMSQRAFAKKDRLIALFALIFAHIQLVVGLVLYFISPKGWAAIGDANLRLTAMEHPAINILAIVFITIGWSTHKKQTEDAQKFKKIAFLYIAGLLLILSRIPWTNWLG